MKRLLSILFIMMSLSVSSVSCGTDEPIVEAGQPETPDDNNNNDNNNPTMSNHLKITVGTASFSVALENNAAATAFKALLPMTVNMSELNGNEKYYYLSGSLPTASVHPGTIGAGDLMLYGSSCLVLFYETFSTSYNYTRLGRMSDASGLAAALGAGNVSVTFEIQ
ncbi:cyclophilin-like fold protein [Bacteroides timonensis]|uniref:cyclophilin-like fold protein n=1 Tax=Bacteroides timonensis TaxID=1470345 RepID=UPI0005C5E993|nr:cyclophilin-like fold protein [Bacteroides timonensis]